MSLLRAYCRAFTWQRLVNEIRCRWSYMLSCGKVRLFRHKPCFLSVEPANYCQLSCPECFVGANGRQHSERRLMDFGVFKSAIEELSPTAHTVQFFFQGEPLLNPQLPQMIAYAHNRRMVTIVSTNAQVLDCETAFRLVKSGLDKIIVSLDGLTQTSYEQYRRGGKLQRVVDALGFLAEAKKECRSGIDIEVQCLLLKTNSHEWADFKKQYRRLGATSLSFKTAQISDPDNFQKLLPDNPRHTRYRKTAGGQYLTRKPMRRRCLRLWRGCVITADAKMLPCCFDKAARHSFGQAATNTSQAFLPLWFSAKAQAFRNKFLTERPLIAICNNCTE